MHVSICDEVGQRVLAPEEIERLVAHVLEGEGAQACSEVCVSFVGVDEIHELNRDYRGIDRPTDVLSFGIDDPDEEPEFEDGPDEILMLGDVIICPQIVTDQAPGFGNTPADEMRLLLTHGCLHLMGYDHEDEQEAQQMEALERHYLASFCDAPVEELNVGPTVDHVAEGSAACAAGRPAQGDHAGDASSGAGTKR